MIFGAARIIIFAFGLINVCSGVVKYKYQIVDTIGRPSKAFTQGLTLLDSNTYLETTGDYGDKNSVIRKVGFDGQVKKSSEYARYFLEGSTTIDEDQNIIAGSLDGWILYFKSDLSLIKEVESPFYAEEVSNQQNNKKQVWGMTYNKGTLYITDGETPYIHHVDPVTLETKKSVKVTMFNKSVFSLNEMEWSSDGFIWANRFQSPCIYKIDPETGDVAGVMDMRKLYVRTSKLTPAVADDNVQAVLNGIMEIEQDRLYVTGKLWPVLYEVEVTAELDIDTPLEICDSYRFME